MSGYVRIHRSLLGHPAFRNEAETMAFAWLICRASWKPVRVRYKGRAIMLSRGQVAISVRDFADAMDRDKAWIERLLKRLKRETMIATSDETGVNVITICNYADYQASTEVGETLNETAHETGARQPRDTEQGREEGKKEVSKDEATPHLRLPALPVSEAAEAWNEVARRTGWKAIKKLSEPRKAALRARLRDEGLDGWKAALARAHASPFLGGDPPPDFFTFDWVVKPGNFLKLIEGNYDRNRTANPGRKNGWLDA